MKQPTVLVISNYSDPVVPIRPEAEIMLRLQRLGFHVVVMTPDKGFYPTALRRAGCTIIDYRAKSKFDFTSIRLIREAIEKHSISIVHAFNSKAIANAAWALIFNRRVKLVSYRGYTGNIHWYDPSNYLSYLNPRIDYMVCLAESVREMYLENFVDPARTVTLHKGHDPVWYNDIQPADLSKEGLSKENLVYCLVANNRTKMKGIHYVVDAAALLPKDLKITFLMVGKGLDDDDVRARIRRLQVTELFHFTGYRADAASLVKASDVVISASLFGEATQKAIIEALYMSKPVIITDISGNRGMVRDGVTGLVVEAASGKAMADAVLSYYRSPSLRTEMGIAGRDHIGNFLSIENSVKAYAEFYERITSE